MSHVQDTYTLPGIGTLQMRGAYIGQCVQVCLILFLANVQEARRKYNSNRIRIKPIFDKNLFVVWVYQPYLTSQLTI